MFIFFFELGCSEDPGAFRFFSKQHFDGTIIVYYYYPFNYMYCIVFVLLCLVALHGG